MFKTKRKRAVVLALIAFFCTAAATYVAVDWKRFGGGVLAFFKGGRNDAVAGSMGGSMGSKPVQLAQGGNDHSNSPTLPAVAPATSRKHPSGVGGGANGHASDEDLFKFGNPAAGGIPPGNFIVAQNDTPSGGNTGGADFVPPVGAPAAPETSSPAAAGGAGVTSPAPAPAGVGAGSNDVGIAGGGKGTTPAPPVASPPAAGTPPAASPPSDSTPVASPPAATPPAPAPIQAGTTDDPGTPPPPPAEPPTDAPPPSTSLPPVSAVPEASSLAMISLGTLFLAVAASRRRKQA